MTITKSWMERLGILVVVSGALWFLVWVTGFDVNTINYELGAERPRPRVQVVNTEDFALLPVRGASTNTLEEDFERNAALGGSFNLIGPNQTVGWRTDIESQVNGYHCSSDVGLLRFLRIVDETGLERVTDTSVRNISLSNFEEIAVLGPGYCFDDRIDDEYIVGGSFRTIEDVR